MKQLVIVGGNRGTGKTALTAALAHLASQERPVVMVDADVDTASLELLLSPKRLEERDFAGRKVAVVEPKACTACGICAQACRFGAVIRGESSYAIDPSICEGCHSCFYQCPAQAIHMQEQVAGQWFRSSTPFGPLFHAHLFAEQENEGKLVRLVKQQAQLTAVDAPDSLLLVDAAPGVGSPVVVACIGADAALVVAEPTSAGARELERMLQTMQPLRVPTLVMLNKVGRRTRQRQEIEDFCATHSLPVVGEIPADAIVSRAMADGQPATADSGAAVSDELRLAWQRIKGHLGLPV